MRADDAGVTLTTPPEPNPTISPGREVTIDEDDDDELAEEVEVVVEDNEDDELALVPVLTMEADKPMLEAEAAAAAAGAVAAFLLRYLSIAAS